jgi:hypothetical protein
MNSIPLFFSIALLLFFSPGTVHAAYHHMGESDTPNFLQAYPEKTGTKLDNCVLCHKGGSYRQANGKKVDLGSCQWCHHTFGYDGKGNINETLNPFGKDYRANGRNAAALRTIERLDSDGDSFANLDEIRAVRFPGDSKDDPEKVIAPFRIFTRKQLEAMPQHTQLLLMNTAKAVDSYVEFSGVPVETLLDRAGLDSSATKITVYSPDGYAQGHPLEVDDSGDPFVKGVYPAARYFYDTTADKEKNPGGWCEYRSPATKGLSHGAAIQVRNGLRLLLALRADGKDLPPGKLGPSNALEMNSRGPFCLVAPQKSPGPPDQPSTRSKNNIIWPYDYSLDHNGGSSTKCATIIKIEPLPAGSTDIDVTEAGWTYIEQERIILYGALQGPKLLAPESGVEGVSWNPVHFSWEKSPGIDAAEVTSYRLEYTKDDPGRDTWEGLSVTQQQTARILEPNTTYYWRVRDLDENGGSTVSRIYRFTTGK